MLPDSLAVHEEWRRLLVTHGVSGVQVHDARLAAAMRVHGVKRILTFNDRDFTRFTHIEAIHVFNKNERDNLTERQKKTLSNLIRELREEGR